MRQVVKSKSNIVEKVILDKEGRLVCATFQVYENAGRIKARLIDFVYITAGAISGKVAGILGSVQKTDVAVRKLSQSLLSPTFYLLSSIYSTGSKPRAPSL